MSCMFDLGSSSIIWQRLITFRRFWLYDESIVARPVKSEWGSAAKMTLELNEELIQRVRDAIAQVSSSEDGTTLCQILCSLADDSAWLIDYGPGWI